MSAPSNFDPQPRDPGARPPPMPPRYLKHQIYTDPRVFKHIDDHAINEARTNYRNFRDLIWNLIYKKNFNELEKTRAIFRWMTTKNMYTIMFDSELPGSPEAIIGGFKDGKTTYARIFECLCSYAGMYCVTLSGWAKGVDYRPGQPITSGPINHSWNCVHIDGNWQLVDSHWATRYLQSERNTPENLVYEYDDFYFIPVPANLIYSHMPEDPAWQALYPAQSRAEYEDHPLVKSFFFNIGMQFTQQKQGVMYTKKGILVVTLGFTRPAAFTFKLGYGDAMVESVKGIQLKRYIIQETSQNHVSFYFRAPREGNYYLTVFAQHVSDRIKLENVFKAVCEYKFVCEQAAGDIRPYPQCSDSNWGPGAPVRQYGLIPNHTEAILLAPNGRAEVAFQKTRDVRLYARLAKDGMDEDTLERSVAVREQDNQIFITVHLPTRGEYGLEIYANEPSKEGDTFTHMCQYLASFIERDPSQMYGQVYDRADLTLQPSSTGPLMYSGTTSEYAASPAEIQRLAPNRQYGGVLPESAMQQQYDAQQSLNWPNRGPSGQWQNQGPHYAGAPGQGQQYSPGQQQYRQPGGPGGQQYDQNQQYGGPGSGPMGQYQGGSQQYGPGGKQGPEYGAPPASPGHDLMSRTETTAVGSGKKPPPTAPKPRRGGQEDDQLPPPPPDMMDQQYNQHAQPAQDDLPPPPPELLSGPGQSGANRRPPPEEPKEPPIEIVYVPSGKPGKTDRGDPQKGGQGPVEIVYVGGSKGTLGRKDGSNEKLAPGQRSPGQGSGSGSTDRLHPTQEWDGTGVRPSSQSPNHLSSYSTDMASSPQDMERNGPSSKESPSAGHKGGSPRYAVLAGSRTPSGASDGRSPYGDQYDRDRQHRGEPVEGGTYHFGAPDSAQNEFGYANRPTEPEREYQPQDKLYTTSITIEPPKDFKPKPVQHQEAPKPLPPSVPPKPFKDTKVFSKVDSHAVEVSKEEHKNFRELVWHLIYAREITNDLEKARAIFLWLCSKDLAKLNFDNVPKGSPEEILMNLQRGQTTYAVVYETLCRYAGLHCQTISGYAKGAEYKPGMQFTGEQGQHSWNAVLVEGAWRLVDCHWAARRLVGKKVTAENVRYELDEYYFMPDPHQLIFTHFPDNTSWQLLERSISLSDFENLVPVKSAFFKYGLQILSHKEAVIRTTREVTIRIGCPPFKSQSLAFTFTLSYDDGKEEYHGTKLNRYGMQELLDNVSFFTIRPPEKGSYRLILYAKDLTQASKEGVYGGVCEYEVISESASVKPQPFPPCVHTSWGPGDSAHKYSLTPLQKGAIFSTVNGQAELKFNIPKELRFTAKLKSNEQDEKALQGFIMHRVVNDVAVFTITAPSPGEFGLEIYANDPEVDGNSLYHAFQYLIICSEVKGPVEALPVLPPGYLGPQPTFKKLGLNTISHNDPYLQTDCGDLEIIFSLGQPLRMTSQLIYVSQNKNEDFSDYLLQQGRGGNNVAFSIKLPKTGMYKFQVYALPFSDTSESLPGVYNYLINCRMTQATLLPFPKQYGQWKEGCYLHEPLDGQLQANRPIKGNASSFEYIYFKVDVPKANSVAIVVGDDWTQLEQKNNGPWEGEVFMEKHWGKESKAALCANYGTVKASYSTLLEYTL